jgi:Cu2+-exporting ATPase
VTNGTTYLHINMTDADHPNCFHCDLEIDPSLDISVAILGHARPMCCEGCAAVARAIVDAKLESYYTHRTESSRRGEQLIPEQLKELSLYDHPDIQKTFVHSTGEHVQEASLILEGINCAACVWLNQQHLSHLDGVIKVEINYTSLKAIVQWDKRTIALSEILKAIQSIGYTAHPYDPERRQLILENARNDTLKRLGVAGIFGMQVMGLAISLYLDDGSMEPSIKHLLQRSSLILTLPVIFYAARPFFSGALSDLKARRFGMDTPVALGISLAFLASLFALISRQGEIYFDSVCMFSFLLLGARYLEVAARKRAADSADIVGRIKPLIARRIDARGNIHTLPALELEPGDQIVVRAGDTVPADGLIVSGESSLDESILTGESMPQFKSLKYRVIGGSLNIDSPITVEVSHTGSETILSGIQRLLDEAQQAKPAIAQLADRIAGWFVLGVLSLASLTGLVWYLQSPGDWLSPTIAVLIVSCPCALSLATPASITTAIGHLMKHGIVVSQKDALESLHKLEVLFFDKTGTLTEGRLEIQEHHLINSDYAQSHFAICSAIEQQSEHPIAKAFSHHPSEFISTGVKNHPGKGLSASVENTIWYLGTPEFIHEQAGHVVEHESKARDNGQTCVVLACKSGSVAVYWLADTLRADSAELIHWLQKQRIQTIMLTGDQAGAAQHIADQTGIHTLFAAQLPADKLATMKSYQNQNGVKKVVGMVGDGVNDAAVLAASDCAIATRGAAALTASGSDILLLTPKLIAIKTAIQTAHKTHAIIKQNLIWASGYNLLAIPAAALGYVPPWAAAIGMSISSLLVVLNALRLK